MRKILAVIVFTLLMHTYCFAQVDTIKLSQINKGPKIVTDRAPQAVYFQIGGSGPILSANYDRRFAKRLNGFGFAAGIGFFADSEESVFSIPVSLNYLIGRKTHFIELAAGTTFINDTYEDWWSSTGENITETYFIHHVNVGYRHQPATGGLFLRGGFSPLFDQGDFVISFYLGFGYNF
jgi:hypothetical protein